MVPVERAVILSAGQGSRLLPLTEDLPKCLIDLGGKSMLQWQLEALADAGIREAVIVTGFRSDRVEEALTRIVPASLTARTLFNPFYKVADNLASCWMAREALTGPCVLLNGDTLISTEIAKRLLAAPPGPITLTIDRNETYDDDAMKTVSEGDVLRAVGKTLSLDVVNGESIGFSRYDDAGSAIFRGELERIMRTADGTRLWYLSVIHRIASTGSDVRVASIEGLEWEELDFAADLVRCRALATGWVERPPRG